LSYNVFGDTITDAFLKRTFFGHFCAGEDTNDIHPVIERFDKNGIGSILDYAAESDITEDTMELLGELTEEERDIKVRTYNYLNEALCDSRAETFASCLRSANAVKGANTNGFVAVKCTALTNPKLLEKMSTTVVELRNLFLKFDKDETGFVTKEHFRQQFDLYFTSGEEKDVEDIFDSIDTGKDGMMDYIEWSNTITVEDLYVLTSRCKSQGPLFNATFSMAERELLLAMRDRIEKLANLAYEMGVHMMLDAEHTYFQPAIDNIAFTLMKK
jgi:proline dehydrogenase